MSLHETRVPDHPRDDAAASDGPTYALLEQARLCCAHLRATSTEPDEHLALGRIHRELGLAGWCASFELDSVSRRSLLATAQQQAVNPMRDPGRVHALAAIMIEAEDAVTTALARTASDHMHDARMHLLWAMELIAARI
jgi:hypothetical protein